MASDIIGGGWHAADDTGILDSGFFEYIQTNSSNGIVIDGVVAWLERQLGNVAENVWMEYAVSSFCDEEVSRAKTALWKASENRIGEPLPRRQGTNKRRGDIEDIVKALRKLESSSQMPLLLATSSMLSRTPNASGITGGGVDIAQRIAVLESSMESFMKKQTEQIKSLSDIVVKSSNQTASTKPMLQGPH